MHHVQLIIPRLSGFQSAPDREAGRCEVAKEDAALALLVSIRARP